MIRPATLRDATFIGANMRANDAHEILCQLPEGTSSADAAAICFATTPDGWKWTAWFNGQPVAAFGVMALTHCVWQGWAFGTDRMARVIPMVSLFMMNQRERMQEHGCRRLEARAFKRHNQARVWITHMGGTYRCDLPEHGRNGETFELWEWVYSDVLCSKGPQPATSGSAANGGDG